ncbi:tetratricopeptide repeat protein [Cooperia oncophora]
MTTEHDRAVLNHILNPLMPTTDMSNLEGEVAEDAPITTDGIEESRTLEKAGVELAESGNVRKAIEKFNEAIEKCPFNPSAFNNRPQALRLVGKTESSELGSLLAKMQMVALNPYAAMCNKMLSEVFDNLKQGKPTDQ